MSEIAYSQVLMLLKKLAKEMTFVIFSQIENKSTEQFCFLLLIWAQRMNCWVAGEKMKVTMSNT
jgi:hypothetical protein